MNLSDAMPAALIVTVQTMSVFILLGILGCELWCLLREV